MQHHVQADYRVVYKTLRKCAVKQRIFIYDSYVDNK